MARQCRKSIVGPVILIGIGVFMLLGTMHMIHWPDMGIWFARYWPVLLIVWGVIRLVEFMLAKQAGTAPPRWGGGSIALIILLVILGTAATSAHRNFNFHGMNDDMEMNGPWAEMFHGDPHEYDARQDFPFTGKEVSFRADRAEITVSPSPDDQIHVLSHLTVYAHSQGEADSQKEKFNIKAAPNGAVTTITAGNLDSGKSSFEVQVPASAVLELSNTRGDINLRDRKAGVTVNTQKSDVTAENIDGNLTIHSGGRSSLTAHQVQGDVSVQGKFQDITATDLTGAITLDGDFFGDLRLQKVAKGVHFHSARTELELAKVEGELNMSTGDLQATSVAGPVRVITRAKDIHLERVSGDVDLEDQNASVELHPESPMGDVRVQNTRGSIDFVSPESANFVLQARADNGEITSDIDVPVQSDSHGDSTANGTVGKGGKRVTLSADRGSITLRKQ